MQQQQVRKAPNELVQLCPILILKHHSIHSHRGELNIMPETAMKDACRVCGKEANDECSGCHDHDALHARSSSDDLYYQ